VSGGTGLLSLRSVRPDGTLDPEVARADLGRGQPDLRLSPDGRRAFVSVHLYGPHFALRVARLASGPLRVEPQAEVELETWGFTPGGARPASFPIQSALVGETLLVAHASGVAALDVRDPAAPRRLAVVEVGVEPVGIDASSDFAAVVGSLPEPRLVLLDLRDAGRARVLHSVALPAGSRPTGVAFAASQLLVAAGRSGVLVFERRSLAPSR
jgi:hypothetical protein